MRATIKVRQASGECQPKEDWSCKLVSWCQLGGAAERRASKERPPGERVGRGQWFFESEVSAVSLNVYARH